ncbi:MAG: terpene cyclase/mutase family protein [Planctomycetaceae bacterium]|nr:terpene cyclase/mutase family protein [Planctomycetaceae bacterium]
MKRLFALAFILFIPLATAQDAAQIQQSIDKAVAYLRTTQNPTGSWSASPRTGIGPTAVILAGLIDAGVDIDDPMLANGLRLVASFIQEDGGIYTPDGFLLNYETSVAVMCLAKANAAAKKKHGTEPYKELLAKADRFLRSQQFTEDNNTRPEDPHYGGIGYGRGARPDLSHVQFFLDALKATGAEPDDPAIQKALVFVSRCQNLESEHNTMPFVSHNAANLDGGFIYVNEPSLEGEGAAEGLKSYGAMTYAGLKSMIYAALTPDDQRVRAAMDWISRHYTVTENPGRGAAGLYYYFQTMSKTLDVLALRYVESGGKQNNWRADLSEHLISEQRPDGSWVNTASSQFMENDTNLVTGYALLTLALCLPGGE